MDLTWRARQLGQALGVRMPDVFVEDSSRAAHLAFASHQGHNITLSRKLMTTFSAAETDFVLAHHLACMKRRGGGEQWLLLLPMLLLMFLPVLLVSGPRLVPGMPSHTGVFLSPWFMPGLFAYFGLLMLTTIGLGKHSARRQAKRVTEADQDALEATGDYGAALSALDKLIADDLPVQINSAFPSRASTNTGLMKTGQLLMRRAEVQKRAPTLHFAPAPAAQPADPASREFISNSAPSDT